MKLNKIMLAIAALTISGGAFAHGYVQDPPSRDYLCNAKANNQNTDCGEAQWTPTQAGETFDGFPATWAKYSVGGEGPAGAADGYLVSGSKVFDGVNGNAFRKLDVQTADRWAKVPMQSGPRDITWFFSAGHKIGGFKYWITKEDWNPNMPLTRDTFEKEPFATIAGDLSRPADNSTLTHNINIPERSGYHVIYATWEVDDTSMTFYKAIDAEFEDKYEGEWTRTIGSLTAERDLQPGYSVQTRVIDKEGKYRPELDVKIDIKSTEQGLAKNWTHALASKINEQPGELRAGKRNQDSTFTPIHGTNTIYTTAGSDLSKVELLVTEADAGEVGTIAINNLQDKYEIVDGKATIGFELDAKGEMSADIQISDAAGVIRAETKADFNDNNQDFSIVLDAVKPGKYTLNVVATTKDGYTLQSSKEFKVASPLGDVDFVFPDGVGTYKPGSRVLQPANDKVYVCKIAGWCNQSGTVAAYEPGVGFGWSEAWTEE